MPFDAGKVVVGQPRAARQRNEQHPGREPVSAAHRRAAAASHAKPTTPKVEPPCAWPSASFQGSERGELC